MTTVILNHMRFNRYFAMQNELFIFSLCNGTVFSLMTSLARLSYFYENITKAKKKWEMVK